MANPGFAIDPFLYIGGIPWATGVPVPPIPGRGFRGAGKPVHYHFMLHYQLASRRNTRMVRNGPHGAIPEPRSILQEYFIGRIAEEVQAQMKSMNEQQMYSVLLAEL